MRVLGLVGSPRKKGNTDILVDKILEGAGSMGCSVEKVYLYDLEIRPCIDCRNCKKELLECTTEDDMQRLYPKLVDSDVFVLGTPLYWYGPSAQMKLFIDRLRPYGASKKLEGKKAILVVPSEEGGGACEHLVGMFEQSFNYLGIELAEILLVKAYEKGEVKKQADVLRRAFSIGKSLL